MALTSGTRLGPHDIVAPIGAGGMGEVYRATDSNLKRASNRDGANGIYVKNTGGATPEELVLKSEFPLFPADWSSDGKYIVYTEENPKTKTDIWVLPVSGERKPVLAVQTPFADSSGQLSPPQASRVCGARPDEAEVEAVGVTFAPWDSPDSRSS